MIRTAFSLGRKAAGVAAAVSALAILPNFPASAQTTEADAAIYRAAGLKNIHGHWESGCNDGNPGGIYDPATITDRADLNGDGRPDAMITEGGVYCYGNTGQAFWIVAQQADGGWKLMLDATGIPVVRTTKGVDGWPDIMIGGPGMCFPVVRWNGKTYEIHGHSDGTKACKPMG